MKKLLYIPTLILLATFTLSAQQLKVFADKKNSNITYTMHHPLHEWDGISRELNSVILTDANRSSIAQVAVNVKIASFDSKNANRDSHMVEVTEGLKYPNITFTSTEIQQQGDQLQVKGILNFHGVNRNISFQAQRKMIAEKLEVSGTFTVKMTQFNIEPPSLLGMATNDDFKISFKALY